MKKEIQISLSLIIIALISGCAVSKPIYTKNGKQGHSINCAGGTMEDCYKKAGDLCRERGYEVLDKNNRPSGLFTSADMRLIIECK